MRRKFSSDDRLWFTSDTHYGHAGIILHCHKTRGMYQSAAGPNLQQMDEELICSWNATVEPDDHVFHLGDVSFHRNERTLEILSRLNGIKYLIMGNHDRHVSEAVKAMFDGGWEHYHEITVDSQLITMCHFPIRSWNGMHYNSWNLHGHSHGTLAPIGKQLDVGVDSIGFVPWSYYQIKADMDTKKFERTDHHTPRIPNEPQSTPDIPGQ